MPTPLALSDEEMDVLHRLAAPIAYGRREEFLHDVTAALASCPEPGPAVVYRTAREIQRSFTLGRAAGSRDRCCPTASGGTVGPGLSPVLLGRLQDSAQKFTEGQAVKIRCGAFDNREARYARPSKRNMSMVMIVLLNRVVAVQVPTHALAASA